MIVAAAFLLSIGAPSVRAVDTAAEIERFEKTIRPILAQHCYKCHGAAKAKGSLRLDRAEGWLRGGDSGPAIVPGKPNESLLLRAVQHQDAEVKMPPSGKLADSLIGTLEDWIARGAVAPSDGDGAAARPVTDIETGRNYWAYQLPKDLPPPAVNDVQWPDESIDHFILARLEASGLRPQVEADRATLIRRVYFDLWGLPPEPEAVEAFENDPSPESYAALVDRLLASPRFGEPGVAIGSIWCGTPSR